MVDKTAMLRKLLLVSLVVAIVAIIYYNFFSSSPTPVIKTENGEVQGIISKSRDGREFLSFRGIPFAKPPIGELRFESPKPPESWEGVWDASYFRSQCLQLEFFMLGMILGSEDCLYLNVYVPKIENKEPLPVMVYIHGGIFHVGSAEVAGPAYLMDEDIILITLNYRLGALGFLNTGDGVIRGNMGLKDQNMALKWVQTNVKSFGGDPSKVTIFGESAGGASVHHHILSPMSKGLFHRAIHQSGSSIHYWALYRNVKEQAIRFGKKFNCDTDDSKNLATCLKKLDAKTLAEGYLDMLNFYRPQITIFAPSIETIKDDDAFITEEPIELLRSGRFNKVPILAGCNSHEGLLMSAVVAANQTKLDEVSNNWDTWAPKALQYSPDLKHITKELRKFYFGSETGPINQPKYFQNLTNLYGDRYFSVATAQSGLLESKYVPTYMYYYDHKGGFNVGRMMSHSQGKYHFSINMILYEVNAFIQSNIFGLETQHLGTSHGDEVAILFSGFHFQLFFSKRTDLQISKCMVRLWADFGSNKTPLKFRDVKFPEISNGTLQFVRISNNPAVIHEPFQDRRIFWESLNVPKT